LDCSDQKHVQTERTLELSDFHNQIMDHIMHGLFAFFAIAGGTYYSSWLFALYEEEKDTVVAWSTGTAKKAEKAAVYLEKAAVAATKGHHDLTEAIKVAAFQAEGDSTDPGFMKLVVALRVAFILLLIALVILLVIMPKEKPKKAAVTSYLTKAAAVKATKLDVESTTGFAVGDTIHIFTATNKVGETAKVKTITIADAKKKIGASIDLATPLKGIYTIGTTVQGQATTTLTHPVTANVNMLDVDSTHGFTVDDTIHIFDVGETVKIKTITIADAKKKIGASIVFASPLKGSFAIGAAVQHETIPSRFGSAAAVQAEAMTTVTAPVAAKVNKLDVASTDGFKVGDMVHIFNMGEKLNITTITIADAKKKIGESIVLALPLKCSYAIGATVQVDAKPGQVASTRAFGWSEPVPVPEKKHFWQAADAKKKTTGCHKCAIM